VARFDSGELRGGPQPPPAAAGSAQAVFAEWLRRQYAAAVAALLHVLGSGADARTQLGALAALMEFVRGEQPGAFANLLFARVAAAAACARGAAPETLAALAGGKYGRHADVRYFLLRTLRKICERHAARPAAAAAAPDSDSDGDDDDAGGAGDAPSGEVSAHDLARNVYDALTHLSPQPSAGGEGEEALSSWCGAAEVGLVGAAADGAEGARQRKKRKLAAASADAAAAAPAPPLHAKWASPKLARRAYSDAWLALLRLPLPDDIYRKVLARLPDGVIPHLFSPLLLSDFLTHSLDRGGLIGMLALNGIFLLVTRHGLEYPRFYERLYGLLDGDAFRSRHRLRFFQLADVFLASGLVPAYTAAAFAKRFARLALRGPPAAGLVAVAFVHNVVRRHPACMQLLHRAPAGGVTGVAAGQARGEGAGGAPAGGAAAAWRGQDVYLEDEADPAAARALESSLWELTALRQHGDPMVRARPARPALMPSLECQLSVSP
jgi:U3 small nucleolar RNA-associated protein 19